MFVLIETGALSVSVADTCFVTCAKTKIKVILEYLEEGWLGRTQNKVQGVIFNYDAENDNMTKIKDVPDRDILGRVEGNWQDKVYYTLGNQPFAKAKVSPDLFFNKHTQYTNDLNRRSISSLTSTRSSPSPKSSLRSKNSSPMSPANSGKRSLTPFSTSNTA